MESSLVGISMAIMLNISVSPPPTAETRPINWVWAIENGDIHVGFAEQVSSLILPFVLTTHLSVSDL